MRTTSCYEVTKLWVLEWAVMFIAYYVAYKVTKVQTPRQSTKLIKIKGYMIHNIPPRPQKNKDMRNVASYEDYEVTKLWNLWQATMPTVSHETCREPHDQLGATKPTACCEDNSVLQVSWQELSNWVHRKPRSSCWVTKPTNWRRYRLIACYEAHRVTKLGGQNESTGPVEPLELLSRRGVPVPNSK